MSSITQHSGYHAIAFWFCEPISFVSASFTGSARLDRNQLESPENYAADYRGLRIVISVVATGDDPASQLEA
jgi:hypothetical protein